MHCLFREELASTPTDLTAANAHQVISWTGTAKNASTTTSA